MADIGLDKAISDAAAEISGGAPPKVGEEPEVTVEIPEGEETPDGEEAPDGEETSDDLSDDELTESKNLYKLLKDPKTAKAVVAALAAQNGLFPGKGEEPLTKKEETAAKREIKDILSEALGDEYKFLSDKLSKAFESVLEQERGEQNSRFAEIQRQNVEREVTANYERLAKETKGESKKFESRMAQLAEEIPIGSMDVRTYLDRLYTVASSEQRKVAPQKVADKIRRNAGDASARLKSGAVQVESPTIPDKKMNLDEAIQFAVNQQRKK